MKKTSKLIIIFSIICVCVYIGKTTFFKEKKYNDLEPTACFLFDIFEPDLLFEHIEAGGVIEIVSMDREMYGSHESLVVRMKVKDSGYGFNIGDELFTYRQDFMKDFLEVGKEYFILGEFANSFAFPENCFFPSANDFFLEVKGNSLTGLSKGADKFLKKSTKPISKMKELTYAAGKKNAAKKLSKETAVVNSFSNMEDMHKASDIVAYTEIKIEEMVTDNLALVKFSNIEYVKGDGIKPDVSYFLPISGNKSNEDNKCIVFLEDRGNLELFPVAREGAVIFSSSKDWENAVNFANEKMKK